MSILVRPNDYDAQNNLKDSTNNPNHNHNHEDNDDDDNDKACREDSQSSTSHVSQKQKQKQFEEVNNEDMTAIGLQMEQVYRTQMGGWRFKVRSELMKTLGYEMGILGSVQRRCRSRTLDVLMVHSAWLGSHQFFILTLPLIFWIGDHQLARSQVYILAMSVYLTGAAKDLFCIPRPYSPPITRLSISNHAAEYGFPSTHSATSSAIALVGLQFLLQHLPSLNSFTRFALLLLLALYEFILVFGRVYCGMHSIQDVVCGGAIGVFAWYIYRSFGLQLEHWVTSPRPSGYPRSLVPSILVISGLLLTAAHPQPIEDCPCFEDSTAFVAVSVGVMTGHWLGHEFIQEQADRGVGNRLDQAVIKLMLGLTVLFGWRFVMKELLSRLLPPIFKICAPLLELPRRHYATTRDYHRYRDELCEYRRRTGLRARLIPSVLHLSQLSDSLRNRHPPTTTTQQLEPKVNQLPKPSPSPNSTPALDKRYDVDVLMRLIVYSGIGFLSSYGLPRLFNLIGLDD